MKGDDIWVLESYEVIRKVNSVADQLLDLRYYAHKNTEEEIEAYRRAWKACLVQLGGILNDVLKPMGSGEGILLDWES